MIELQVHGDPSACYTTSDDLDRLASVASSTIDTLSSARSAATGAWTGDAAEAFDVRLVSTRTSVATLEGHAEASRDALREIAREITTLDNRMTAIAADARAGGLAVTATSVLPPGQLAEDSTPEAVTRHNDRVTLYNSLVERAREARDAETQAHERLTSSLRTVTGDGAFVWFLKGAGLVPRELSGAGVGGWLAAGALTGLAWRAS
ncbi:WXG100 family type VII secretion target, partial [Actinotalea sp. C106]|uniref:WXG100 family type VII secretion target n=1 Tax=Actinotalea sp. C106 TaxID=2908644 RepID=UPI002027E6C7